MPVYTQGRRQLNVAEPARTPRRCSKYQNLLEQPGDVRTTQGASA